MRLLLALCTLLLSCMIGYAQVPEKSYAKFDFIPGDKVLFEDNLANEKSDEIPSRWIVAKGKVETVKINNELAMGLLDGTPTAYPRQTGKNIYKDRITLEFDYLFRHNSKSFLDAWNEGTITGAEYFEIYFANDDERDENVNKDYWFPLKIYAMGGVYMNEFAAKYSSGEKMESSDELFKDLMDKWVHVSIAINENTLRVYLNSERVLNAPAKGKILTFQFQSYSGSGKDETQVFIRNVRIAEGGADPYQQLSVDGRMIARGINFDVAKATIRAESMGALNTIVKMMQEHPELKFEIGGHTDSDSDDASNLKLSQARADAVRERLLSMGIDAARLTSKGYGETKPISPNTTADGKANNRRVELVKK